MAHFHGRNAGWPVGGSLEFARAIERRYLGLGGEVQYRARVEKVLVLAGFLRGLGNDDRNDGQVDEQDATFAR